MQRRLLTFGILGALLVGCAASAMHYGPPASAVAQNAKGHVHPGTSSFTWVSQAFSYGSAGDYTPTVSCPSGDHTVAGGYQITGGSGGNQNLILGSYPVVGQNEWRVNFDVASLGGTGDITVFASCTTL